MGLARPLAAISDCWIDEEPEERPTSNSERPTSNNVFYLFKITKQDNFTILTTKAESESTFQHSIRLNSSVSGSILSDRPKGILSSDSRIFRLSYIKIDKAQRHQYSKFDVGRSMFDVQAVRSLIQAIEAARLIIYKMCYFGVVL